MKKFIIAFLAVPAFALGQSKNISFVKKSKDPYITFSKDTLKVDKTISLLMGSSPDGSFKYIQLLNSFNEPIQPADSRAAMKKQEIKFFKQQDGTTYAFTKFFVINIEAALATKEISY